MKILATVKIKYDRHTMLFTSTDAANAWLDENNNNGEYLSYIEEFDDNWNKIKSYVYTEGKENESRN